MGSAPPLIVQHDGGLVLAIGARGARSIADGLRRFAALEKCPGEFHHYRLTRHALWHAASCGVGPERVADFLRRASCAPLPPAVERLIGETMGRYGRLRLVREGGQYWLRADAPTLLAELLPALLPIVGPTAESAMVASEAHGLPLALAQRGPVQAALARRGWPVIDEAGVVEGRPLPLGWRAGIDLRAYQREAVAAFAGGGRQTGRGTAGGRSGLIILPCGAGKTIVGIGASVAVGQHTLVLCPNTTSVQQWLAAFARFTDLPPDQLGVYSARTRAVTPVTVTTYQMLTARRTGALSVADGVATYPHLDRLGRHDWGLVIFDEAHLLPAAVFRLAAELASRRRLGLTATPIREDGREVDLGALIGPVLYDVPWGQLEAQGWIAPVECFEVRVPLFDNLDNADGPEGLDGAAPGRAEWSHRAAATVPEKWPVVRRLVRRHRGESILILGQYLEQLRDLAARLGAPLVSGETPHAEREAILARFREGHEPIVILSRVGNAALDLPNARVAIEVSGNFGSRQEEAQRLGRLLRPKFDGGGSARFYAVVADHPAELAHAARRQRFLIQQGYRYRILHAGRLAE